MLTRCLNDTDGDGNCAACARNPQALCRVAGLQALADEFDALLRASIARAEEKRKARAYPYDLEPR